MTNRGRDTKKSSKTLLLTAVVRHLCEQISESDARHYHMRIQFHSMHTTLDHIESEFSAFSVEYYCMAIQRHRLLSRKDYEQVAMRGHAPDYCGEYPF